MGEQVPISEDLQGSSTSPPNRFFSVSDSGVLVYQTGTGGGGERELTWFDRPGKRLGAVDKPGLYNSVALSPDETRVAVSLAAEGAAEDLWVHELARGTNTRLTFDGARNGNAVWSPDGSRLVWSSGRDNVAYRNLYQKMANGTGTDEALLTSSATKIPFDWSPDGRFLIYGVVSASRRAALWVLPLTGDDRQPTLYLEQAGFTFAQARFSPDGRFVAYTSDASGRYEVYVQPFPVATGGKWLVSQGGGAQPHWRRDGKELFFISPASQVMAATVGAGSATTPDFTAGVPTALFAATTLGGGASTDFTGYDVTADGQKFLTINSAPMDTTAAPSAPITVVLNWTAGLGAVSRK
jgi:Tol biopolymer transport system component